MLRNATNLGSPSLLYFLLLMGYECLGCKRGFDKKGPLRIHEGKCAQYKAETRNRQTNFTKIVEERVAGPSRESQIPPEPDIVPEIELQDVSMAEVLLSDDKSLYAKAVRH
jgi:hypothetical protein